ncbi:MAG: ankyrin repeat domain-containing protein, partial [Synergistaceae bacterium]|nr:ankyrin repeat domain-containing protein [Synergistaceae bacterium]
MKGADFNVKRSMSEFYDNEIDEAEIDKIDSLFFYDETPLHHAAAYNHNPDSIKFLISLGLDVNAEASEGGSAGNTGTPLSCAIENKNIEAVKVLLDSGANPNSEIYNYALSGGYFHLIAMDYKNNPAEAKVIVDALIKAGGNVNMHDELSSDEIASLLKYEEEFVKYRTIFLPRSQWTSDIPTDN